MSVFGLVLVTRLLYSAREGGAPALAPMDASLNLPRESYSHGVRRRVAELAGQGAYDRVTDEVRRTTGAVVPTQYVGFAAFYAICYSSIALLAALIMFEDRDLA